jgi:hypothetical protein
MCGCNKNQAAAAVAAAATVRAAPRLASVDTSVWGAHLWKVLHYAARSAPGREKAFAHMLETLRNGLPCPECSGHYNSWIQAHPVETTTVKRNERPGRMILFNRSTPVKITKWPSFSHWVLDLHNAVNKRKGVATWTMGQLNAVYGNMSAEEVRASMRALHDVIGGEAFSALNSLLHAIGV